MATKLSDAGDALAANEVVGEVADFDGDAEPVPVSPPPVSPKDPMIRRKIEDKLERIRLREELGIYDEDQWKDL
jgi:hypothetical protein